MSTKIFVNLPVRDLDKSMSFFKLLGFNFNPQFTDETAACMVINEHIYTMLLTHDKFAQFTTKPVADATKSTEVLICLLRESRDEVDEFVDAAVKAGATEVKEPMDYGFMFNRSFNDLDGHIWEIMWMDPAAVQSN